MFFRKKAPANPYVRDEGQGVYRVRVRTARHGDVVEVRFTRAAHIGAAEEGDGSVFRKGIVSAEHFDRGELAVHFDRKQAITGTDAEGLTFIPVSEWEE